jgi:dipeptidyl aminopeptidase/acylaminoacyl peptidase
MNADGSGKTQVTDNDQHADDGYGRWTDQFPSWNADSSALVFTRSGNGANNGEYHQNNQVYKVNIDGTGLVNFTESEEYEEQAAWSADGTKIAFVGTTATDGYGVYTINPDGTGRNYLSNIDCPSPGELDWSPDGSKLYYTCYASFKYHIYSANTNETGSELDLTAATDSGLNGEMQPSVSPDGTKVAFLSTRDGNGEIYEMNADGTSPSRKTNNAAEDREPDYVATTWSPSSPDSGLAVTNLTVAGPSVSDELLTRGVTFTGPGSGVLRYDFGWGSTSASAPTTFLQSSTSSTGRVNFRDTTPDADWRLFVRAVGTSGNYGPWYYEQVHTPKKPLLLVGGDSISSGHHRETPEPDVTCEDASYGYPKYVRDAWRATMTSQWYDSDNFVNLAFSGYGTDNIINGGENACEVDPGIDPLAEAKALLDATDTSWNHVLMSAGINNTDWVSTIQTVLEHQTDPSCTPTPNPAARATS